jgi:hypothetical protein
MILGRGVSNNFLTAHARRKTSTHHLQKTDVAESNGGIRTRLWHQLKAKTTSGLILQGQKSPKTRKRWEIDEKCQRNTKSKP